MNKSTDKEYIVRENTTLLPFMLTQLKTSRKAVKGMLARGQFYVDGHAITQFNHPLEVGQSVVVGKADIVTETPSFDRFRILFEDDYLIIVDKASGILSVAGLNAQDPTVYRQLTAYVRMTRPQARVFVVHRLDHDTSGIMVYAKTEETKRTLQDNWKKLVQERKYTAVVQGKFHQAEGTIKSWLKENKAFKVYSSETDNGGKLAITHYQTLKSTKDYSLMALQLETGRKNQIRVHLADKGHPVVGDKKYGATSNPIKRLGLHATSLVFTHPITNEHHQFTSPVPKSFKQLVNEKK